MKNLYELTVIKIRKTGELVKDKSNRILYCEKQEDLPKIKKIFGEITLIPILCTDENLDNFISWEEFENICILTKENEQKQEQLIQYNVEYVLSKTNKRFCVTVAAQNYKEAIKLVIIKIKNYLSNYNSSETIVIYKITHIINVEKLCYDLYVNDWLRRMTYNSEETNLIKEYYADNEIYASYSSYKDFIQDVGYKNGLYCCFDEFLRCEYSEKEYIQKLLNDDNLFKIYLEDLELNTNLISH